MLTERECRQAEAGGALPRFSVEVHGGQGRDKRRWPDVVVGSPSGRRAIEIEFAPKGTARLRAIVGAYEASRYDEVEFMVKSAALGRRIQSLRSRPRALREHLGLPACRVHVVPWWGLSAERRSVIAAELEGTAGTVQSG